jgi:hypothetical protein
MVEGMKLIGHETRRLPAELMGSCATSIAVQNKTIFGYFDPRRPGNVSGITD